MPELTYPVFIGGRLVEVTGQQAQAHQWNRASDRERIKLLLERVEALEQEVQHLKESRNAQ